LQFFGPRLRLTQQFLVSLRRQDGIEADAQGFAKLVQEVHLNGREAVEGGELDDGHQFVFEQHRQQAEIQWPGFAQTGLRVELATSRDASKARGPVRVGNCAPLDSGVRAKDQRVR
jgi:hypothetical protein